MVQYFFVDCKKESENSALFFYFSLDKTHFVPYDINGVI